MHFRQNQTPSGLLDYFCLVDYGSSADNIHEYINLSLCVINMKKTTTVGPREKDLHKANIYYSRRLELKPVDEYTFPFSLEVQYICIVSSPGAVPEMAKCFY